MKSMVTPCFFCFSALFRQKSVKSIRDAFNSPLFYNAPPISTLAKLIHNRLAYSNFFTDELEVLYYEYYDTLEKAMGIELRILKGL
ncbi:hypothetical protein KVJ84_06605 [Helicobacter pylori]|nr:hypothetical protein KVJ84_06605 [Helicobacter pylori]